MGWSALHLGASRDAAPGYLYAFKRLSDSAVKVGLSIDPIKRLDQIRRIYRGDQIEIIRAIPVRNMLYEEHLMHQTIGAFNIALEWFQIPEQLIRFVFFWWNRALPSTAIHIDGGLTLMVFVVIQNMIWNGEERESKPFSPVGDFLAKPRGVRGS